MIFDYNFYLEKYPDLRHFNYIQAYNHWLNYGLREGRACCSEQINIETRVTLTIHLFHEHLFSEFLEYINNVKVVFKLVNVIITININSNFDKVIYNEDPSFIVLKLENKGVDSYSFIECIKYIRNNNIKTDYILKLHTKESINWRKELINPIVDINNLYIIQHYFKNKKNIGYIGAQKWALQKNYDLDYPQNIEGLHNLCKKFQHLEQNWTDFNGGSTFWISNETLSVYLTTELIEYLIANFLYGKPPPDNINNEGVEYICERLWTGVFCYDKTNILVNEFKGYFHGISIINNPYFYQPSVFSFYTPKNIITGEL